MVDFSDLTKKMVADAIIHRLPGLTRKVDFVFYAARGVYDPETDSFSHTYTTTPDVAVVESGITMDDVTAYGVTAKNKKLLVPGISLPQVPRSDVDKVTIAGATWNVSKVKEVPGGSLVVVFVSET
jgi:hypothetical protein